MNHWRVLPVVFTAAWLAASPGLAREAHVPVYREFKDWTVACDNVRGCTAVGMRSEEADSLVAVIRRTAGPNAAASIVLTGPGLDADSRLLLDGRELDLDPRHWRWQPPKGDEEENGRWVSRDAVAASSLLHAIRNGHRVAIADFESDAPAKDVGDLSLDGLGAALLLMDDVQGRVGTQGAWARPGSAPESRVPAAPPLPSLRHAPAPKPLAARDAERLARAVRKAKAGILDDVGCDSAANDEAYALTDSDALVLLECMSGAYQEGSLVFRVPRDAPAKAVLLHLESIPGETPLDQLWLAGYDAASGELAHHIKDRGLGDCGGDARWQFDGKAFHLLAYRRMQRCGGLMPEDWPWLWRARVDTTAPARP
jgi:hypothetical protein